MTRVWLLIHKVSMMHNFLRSLPTTWKSQPSYEHHKSFWTSSGSPATHPSHLEALKRHAATRAMADESHLVKVAKSAKLHFRSQSEKRWLFTISLPLLPLLLSTGDFATERPGLKLMSGIKIYSGTLDPSKNQLFQPRSLSSLYASLITKFSHVFKNIYSLNMHTLMEKSIFVNNCSLGLYTKWMLIG